MLFILKEKEPKLPKVFTDIDKDENLALKDKATKGLLICLNNSFSTNDKKLLDYKNRLITS